MNIIDFVRLLRPQQWLKNLMIFFPPLLSGALIHSGVAERGILPFAAFCCASSASYVFNDLADQDRDAHHPDKKSRPLPSGRVSRTAAALLCCVLLALAVVISWRISSAFIAYIIVYLMVSACYSMYLKNLPIIDLFCISLGFVLRLYGGGEAFDVYISDWLFLTVFLLSIFLSVGKRYSERRHLGTAAGDHRRTLEEYPDGFLESAMYLSGAAVLVTYSIYAISTPLLVYTVPLCMFGLLRYLMRIKSGQSGDPTEALIKDVPLLATGTLWILMVGWSVYQ
jgi:4-hydroxybenzoate polyprenyltransferase